MRSFNSTNLVLLLNFILPSCLARGYGASDALTGIPQEFLDIQKTEGLKTKSRHSVNLEDEAQRDYHAELHDLSVLRQKMAQLVPQTLPPYDEKMAQLIKREDYEALGALKDQLTQNKHMNLEQLKELEARFPPLLAKLDQREEFKKGFPVARKVLLNALTGSGEKVEPHLEEVLSPMLHNLRDKIPQEFVNEFTHQVEKAHSFGELVKAAGLGRHEL